MHYFGNDGGFPCVHRQRQGIIRSLSLSIHIAAFFNDRADIFMCGTWDEMARRLAKVGQLVLDHDFPINTWHYVWCPIEGVGMRHWFRTPLPTHYQAMVAHTMGHTHGQHNFE